MSFTPPPVPGASGPSFETAGSAPRPAASVGGGSVSDADVTWFAQQFAALVRNIATVIQGKDSEIWLALVAMMAEGHILVEDVPGVGKTTLARSIAASVNASVSRIQFTPDLLPSDVSGVSIWNQGNQEFEFKEGPVFSNICVGDEINRASPKTQSALLEVMEERQVTVDGHARPLPRPFVVIATQNPIEMDGTYSLPEAQLDRFLIRMSMGYPDQTAEASIITGRHGRTRVDPDPIMDVADVERMVSVARNVHVSPDLVAYAVAVVASTRQNSDVRLGSSPRGSLGLIRASQALAASEARTFVTPDDVKRLAVPVLAHRLLVTPDATLRGMTSERIIDDTLKSVVVPTSTTF